VNPTYLAVVILGALAYAVGSLMQLF